MKINLKCLPILAMTVLLSILAFGSCFAADNGLVAQYKFNGDCNDASGNGNDGSAVGDVSFADDNEVGKCAVFNGGYINVPSSSGLNLGSNFTISVWLLVDPSMGANGNKTGSIISKLDSNGTYNVYHAYTHGTFGVRMDTRFTEAGERSVLPKAFDDYYLSSGWTNLVLSYDGESLYMYINGVLKSTCDVPGDSIAPSSGKMRIGTGNDINNKSLFYGGKMADLRIYNKAMSFAEIKALCSAGAQTAASVTDTTGSTTTPDITANGTTNPATGTTTPGTDTTTGSNAGSSGPVTIINNNTTNITNSTTTTNNANTNTNITGSTISNSNIASNNQTNQTTSVSNATTVTQYVSVLVNGQSLQSDVNPFINADGRTMLPIRAIAEALGAQVQWDNATQTATLTLGSRVVKVTIGQNSITVDGQPVSMDTIAAIKDGRTLLPVRAVGEAMGAQIGWDASTQTVSIDK